MGVAEGRRDGGGKVERQGTKELFDIDFKNIRCGGN